MTIQDLPGGAHRVGLGRADILGFLRTDLKDWPTKGRLSSMGSLTLDFDARGDLTSYAPERHRPILDTEEGSRFIGAVKAYALKTPEAAAAEYAEAIKTAPRVGAYLTKDAAGKPVVTDGQGKVIMNVTSVRVSKVPGFGGFRHDRAYVHAVDSHGQHWSGQGTGFGMYLGLRRVGRRNPLVGAAERMRRAAMDRPGQRFAIYRHTTGPVAGLHFFDAAGSTIYGPGVVKVGVRGSRYEAARLAARLNRKPPNPRGRFVRYRSKRLPGGRVLRLGVRPASRRGPRGGRTEAVAIAGPRRGNPYTGEVVRIYDQVDRIEATKGSRSNFPREAFYHDFKPGAVEDGLPAGTTVRLPGGRTFRLPRRALLIHGARDLWFLQNV
jgi:hypothetical protein